MSGSAAFGDELDALGIWWPRGDGDALREAAAAWTAMADLIEDIGVVLDAAASSAVENYRGEAANRFADLWRHWSSPAGYLALTVADCRRLAEALTGFATDVDVADRTLVMLIEEALAANGLGGATGLIDLWLDWLRDSADVVGADLAVRADQSSDLLTAIQVGQQPAPPTTPDVSAIQPDMITWPDPGKPGDLSSLGTTDIDFGAGQGRLPTVPGGDLIDVPPTAPGPLPSFGQPAAPVTVIINGDGNTVTVEAGGSGYPTFADPVPLPPFEPLPPIEPLPPLEPLPPIEPLAFDPLESVEDTSSSFGGGFDSEPLPSFDVPPIDSFVPLAPALPDVAALTATPQPVPITIRPPGASGAAIGAAAAATGAIAAKAAGSKQTPFFPMMPMGGGGSGGDDGQEPKRRVTRRLPQSAG